MRSPQPNLFDRMNRIDRIREPDSPAGGHPPCHAAKHRRRRGEKGEIVWFD